MMDRESYVALEEDAIAIYLARVLTICVKEMLVVHYC